MAVQNEENAEYKVTFTVTVRTDGGQDLDREDIVEALEVLFDNRWYAKPSELARKEGVTVERVFVPDEDGTIRRFRDSGNCVIKRPTGWFYIHIKDAPSAGGHLLGDRSSVNEEEIVNYTDVVVAL